ncbi:acyl-CoA thioesterase [Nonomuraea sp. NPDC049607]|uniref:acyl-CoA thioesterase n=1 Tax=Nonomuraea sp. NPDC049607 TaxID=3154732 RepID=UPI0034226ABC
MTFTVRIAVRGYELDTQGHLNNVVYHQYGDHARWECLRAAGISIDDLREAGVGPVTCAFEWGEGRTFRIRQEFRGADGEPAAELTGVGGLMDLRARRLLHDPGNRWRALARTPAVMGL